MAMTMVDREARAATRGKPLAASVRRLKVGVYLVPSQTEPDVTWTVLDQGLLGTGSGLRCTCMAGMMGRPCAHAFAVLARRQLEARKRKGTPR
jgi:hypothetical protein